MKEFLFLRKDGSENMVKYLLILLMITFPFGSHIISVQIAGLFTLNPFMALVIFLFFLGFLNFKLIKKKADQVFLGFMLIWALLGIIQFLYVSGKEDALVDLRSIGLMFLTSYVIIWSKAYLGFDKWRRIIKMGIKSIFILLTLFAIFELMTGIHFIGEFTEKIENLQSPGVTYSPVFLFDNPNNLVVHFLLLGSLLILFDFKSKKNPYLTFFVIVICFLVSLVSLSRIGEAASILLFFIYLLIYIPYYLNFIKSDKNGKTKLFIGTLIILFTVVVFVKNEKYYGPIWQDEISNAQQMEGTITFENDSLDPANLFNKYGALKIEYVKYFNKDSLNERFGSEKIRKGLIFNGLEFFNESKIFGIGLGQYRYRHRNDNIKYYTRTNISPHFWLIEVLSQFGLFIFIPYISILLWLSYIALKNIRSNLFLWGTILSCILVYGLGSLLPSSFLILEVNWIFMALLLGFSSSLQELEKNDAIHE